MSDENDWKATARKWESRAKSNFERARAAERAEKVRFDPGQQEKVDQIVNDRLKRMGRELAEARGDRDAFERSARLWESRAKQNLAVVRAHEETIQKFIDKLDDVLSEGEEDD